ncbi:alpha/beta hydrolase [Planotetraspora silvatica]|uniref:Alpha/beta hydrolase n=1 Tax=Planotetraspora silvatica TaxID=234614 RepID=A0A8J3XTH9_9ACTN|nr:alpha/beta hydrolase [Planotetraspora silvatica]GII51606.1 alpha/beta hydrolase [Planotetraspora silvatica]
MNRVHRRALMTAAAAVAAIAAIMPTASAASGPATAGSATAASPKPTVVLVHGGFADGSNWNGVIKRLAKDGYPVVAPANPLRGLPTDAAYISSFLDSIKGPVILAGHSYGGAVITNAAAGHPNVKALVYVAAFVPDKGEQLGVLIQKYPGSEIQAALNEVPFTNADGSTGTDLYLQPDRFHDVFAADLPQSVTGLMAAEQRPFSASSFTDVTTAAAWHTIPSWGIVATADKSIPPALERFEYQRAGSHVVEVKGASHVVMISHPAVVADVIEDAAEHTR